MQENQQGPRVEEQWVYSQYGENRRDSDNNKNKTDKQLGGLKQANEK